MANETPEDRLRRLEDTIYGPWRNNGMVAQLKSLDAKFDKFIAAETARRENDGKERRRTWLAIGLGMLAALTSLFAAVIGVVAS